MKLIVFSLGFHVAISRQQTMRWKVAAFEMFEARIRSLRFHWFISQENEATAEFYYLKTVKTHITSFREIE